MASSVMQFVHSETTSALEYNDFGLVSRLGILLLTYDISLQHYTGKTNYFKMCLGMSIHLPLLQFAMHTALLPWLDDN